MDPESEFHRSRISQSNYRGGTGKLKKSGTHKSLMGELPHLSPKNKEEKESLKKIIFDESEEFLSSLLPETSANKILESTYYKTMIKKLGL